MVKLLMTWNILPGRESEYFEFIVKEFAPGMQKLGIRPSEVWYTVYGEYPQIMAGGLAQDVSTLRDVLSSTEWQQLEEQLLDYVTDFEHKVIRANGGFQL
jgi:hypothetical protein